MVLQKKEPDDFAQYQALTKDKWEKWTERFDPIPNSTFSSNSIFNSTFNSFFNSSLDLTHLSWSSSAHVMSSAPAEEKLIVELNQSSEQKHLCLSPPWNGIPRLEARAGNAAEFSPKGQFPWEAKSSPDGPPTYESSHGNTSVLDLRVTEPGEGLVGSELGESEWVPHLSNFDGVGGCQDGLLGDAGVGWDLWFWFWLWFGDGYFFFGNGLFTHGDPGEGRSILLGDGEC